VLAYPGRKILHAWSVRKGMKTTDGTRDDTMLECAVTMIVALGGNYERYALVGRAVTRTHRHSAITIRLGTVPTSRGAFAADTTSHYLGSMKRAHEGDDDGEHPDKVQRLLHPDKISRLSEELLVRILSFVPVPSLLVCQR
jgi:hypothetical protein